MADRMLTLCESMPPNVGNAEVLALAVTLSSCPNYRRSEPVASGRKTSPFFAMMGMRTNPHPSQTENGDEGGTEGPLPAAAAVPLGVRPAVSHAPGLQASPPGRAAAPHPAMGSP